MFPANSRWIKNISSLTPTNPPSPPPAVFKAVSDAEKIKLNLYPDPEAFSLRKALAESFGVSAENVIVTNGSDETQIGRASCRERV